MNENSQKMRQIIASLKEHYEEEPANRKNENSFRVLIGCVLSQRTRDANSERAAEALFKVVKEPRDILRLSEARLQELIHASGFYRQKSKYIRGICEALVRDCDGQVPESRDDLLSLPGVGPKTADVILSYAFDKPAVAVDTHVARVAKRLEFVKGDAGNDQIKETLEALVRVDEYRFLDSSLVKFGKEYCRSRMPRCERCFLSSLCAYPLNAFAASEVLLRHSKAHS